LFGPGAAGPAALSAAGSRRPASRRTLLVDVAYQHILVAYDGTSEGDAALLAASDWRRATARA
jgi:hypothetical protein